jgi:hypothetical protein
MADYENMNQSDDLFDLQLADLSDAEKDTRRREMMQISVAAQQRLEADKAALARLRQQLAREGW